MRTAVFAPSVAQVNMAIQLHAQPMLRLMEVARASGQAQAVTQSALNTLEKRGLANRREVAGVTVYEPNRKGLYQASARRAALVDLPIDAALSSSRVLAVYVYGSFASGTERPDSDIDLFVVGKGDEQEVRRALRPLGERLGRRIDVIMWTDAQVRQALTDERSTFAEAALSGILIRGEYPDS